LRRPGQPPTEAEPRSEQDLRRQLLPASQVQRAILHDGIVFKASFESDRPAVLSRSINEALQITPPWAVFVAINMDTLSVWRCYTCLGHMTVNLVTSCSPALHFTPSTARQRQKKTVGGCNSYISKRISDIMSGKDEAAAYFSATATFSRRLHF